jgi:hypothetical protein
LIKEYGPQSLQEDQNLPTQFWNHLLDHLPDKETQADQIWSRIKATNAKIDPKLYSTMLGLYAKVILFSRFSLLCF